MKSTKKLLWAVFTALLVASCGPVTKLITPHKYAQAVTAPGVKPLHIGKVTPAWHEVYHVQVYKHSVVFMATTRITDPSCVEIFDIDHDGTYDVVFELSKGSWNIGTTEQFKYAYKVKVPLTLPDEEVDWWTFQALDVQQKIQGEKPKATTKPATPSVIKKPEPVKAPAPKPVETKPTPSTPPPVETPKKQEPQPVAKAPEKSPDPTGYDGSTIHLKEIQFFDAAE